MAYDTYNANTILAKRQAELEQTRAKRIAAEAELAAIKGSQGARASMKAASRAPKQEAVQFVPAPKKKIPWPTIALVGVGLFAAYKIRSAK